MNFSETQPKIPQIFWDFLGAARVAGFPGSTYHFNGFSWGRAKNTRIFLDLFTPV